MTTRWVSGSDGESSDELYLLDNSQDDYQNLEDSLLVFCVDVSGSMSVTAEVHPPPVWVSVLENASKPRSASGASNTTNDNDHSSVIRI